MLFHSELSPSTECCPFPSLWLLYIRKRDNKWKEYSIKYKKHRVQPSLLAWQITAKAKIYTFWNANYHDALHFFDSSQNYNTSGKEAIRGPSCWTSAISNSKEKYTWKQTKWKWRENKEPFKLSLVDEWEWKEARKEKATRPVRAHTHFILHPLWAG